MFKNPDVDYVVAGSFHTLVKHKTSHRSKGARLSARNDKETQDFVKAHAGQVKVVVGARFVFEDGVSTSAGVSAGIDLALELVRKDFGDKLATEIEVMEYEKYPVSLI